MKLAWRGKAKLTGNIPISKLGKQGPVKDLLIYLRTKTFTLLLLFSVVDEAFRLAGSKRDLPRAGDHQLPSPHHRCNSPG